MWYIFHVKKTCTNSKQFLVRWNLIVDTCNSIEYSYNFAPNRRKKKNHYYHSYTLYTDLYPDMITAIVGDTYA